MEREKRAPFERRLESLTVCLVDQIAACLDRLSELVSLFSSGEPYDRCVHQVQARESDCDETYRSVANLISTVNARDLGIRLTGIHLNRNQLLHLFAYLNEIPNAAERFASDLEAIEPRRVDDCLEGLEEMITSARAGVRFLEESVPKFIRFLTDPKEPISIVDVIGPTRRIESHVDDLRDEVIATAFESEPHATALVYRELALLLDGLVDAIEDVTDQMVLVGGDNEVMDLTTRGVPE